MIWTENLLQKRTTFISRVFHLTTWRFISDIFQCADPAVPPCWFIHGTKCNAPHGYSQKLAQSVKIKCINPTPSPPFLLGHRRSRRGRCAPAGFPFATLGMENAAHPRYYSIKCSQQREQWASLKPALCLSAADSARQLEWGAETGVGHPHKVSLAGLRDVSAASPRRCLQMSLVTVTSCWEKNYKKTKHFSIIGGRFAPSLDRLLFSLALTFTFLCWTSDVSHDLTHQME